MKYIKADLTSDVVSSYNQTKTTVQGRAALRTVSGTQVVAPPLVKWVDVATDTAVVTYGGLHITENGRMFVLGSETGGVTQLLLYEIDFPNGTTSYIGRIDFRTADVAATTTVFRSIKAIDTGTTGWKVFISTTGSVLINGGTYLLNKIDRSDFVPVGFPTINFATTNDQKAVYFLQDPANIGVNQLQTATAGSILDKPNNRLYVHNGVSATHQFYLYDTSIAPTYSTSAVSVSVASPGVVSHAGHAFLANDPVVFTAGTLPTGLTVGTTYFVRNPVAGVSYELSATSGGASINTTGSPSVGAFIGRAFGTTGSNFIHKTGNLPALTGTLIILDSEDYAVPVAAPVNGGVLNGNPCAFFSTSSNLYLGLLSELTSGAVVWPSLTTSNILGTSTEITAPTLTQATWSNSLDNAFYITNTSRFIGKQVVNNIIGYKFGYVSNDYLETLSPTAPFFGMITIVGLDIENGYMGILGSTVGQRGILLVDLRSNDTFDYSYVVTKVLDTENSALRFLSGFQILQEKTGPLRLQYRTSGFGSISGGWTDINYLSDISAVAASNQIQFKILFRMLSNSTVVGSINPAQINELILGLESNNNISDNWEYSRDDSSSGSPTRCAFRLKKAYASSVPTMYFRSYDLSNSLIVNHNTVTNAALFEYSTDGGTNWNSLGVIPNTVGTLIRYTFTVAPGVDFRPSLRES